MAVVFHSLRASLSENVDAFDAVMTKVHEYA